MFFTSFDESLEGWCFDLVSFNITTAMKLHYSSYDYGLSFIVSDLRLWISFYTKTTIFFSLYFVLILDTQFIY